MDLAKTLGVSLAKAQVKVESKMSKGLTTRGKGSKHQAHKSYCMPSAFTIDLNEVTETSLINRGDQLSVLLQIRK